MSSSVALPLEIRSALAGCQGGTDPEERLVAALAQAIQDGRLLGGTILPPERQLSAYLGVGRRVIAAAYGRLETQGLVERMQGRGTLVTGGVGSRGDMQAARRASSLQANATFRDLGARHQHAVDLRSGSGRPSEPILARLQAALGRVDLSALIETAGYYPHGLPVLRERLAAHLSAIGSATSPDELLITTGAQQALALTASSRVTSGDTVVVEDPTFSGTIDALRSAGTRVLGVRVGARGINLDVLEATLSRITVTAIAVSPSAQTPTGATLTLADRIRLLELARRARSVIIEDETMAELSLGTAPPPALFTLDPGAVVSVGSLSKLIWGGLRIGWVRAPRATIDQIAIVKAANDLGSSVIGQAVAAELLVEAVAIRERRRRELAERLAAITCALEARLPEWTVRAPTGGVTLWVRLPSGSATELAARAEQAGLLITPGPVSSPTGSFDDHLALPFDHEPDVLTAVAERLASVWRQAGRR